MCNYVAYNRFL